ncbi:MAG: peptidoglycan editing factor PgeF [Bryobacteraceae bacterium]
MFHRTRQGYYRSSQLDGIEWLSHGFGTRAQPLFDLQALTLLQQIHSDRTLEAAGPCGVAGEGDGLVTDQPDIFLAVKTADCLPLLLVDPANQAVSAVHAGWRGTVACIAERAVRHLESRYGSRPGQLEVAIGPGIGPCCFEVGPEVAVEFQGLFPERSDLDRRTRVDLLEANLRVLEQAGVLRPHVDTAQVCTVCHGGEFHSYRRDGARAGRMLSVVAIRNTKGAGSIPRL